jgi:hypothetical protein
MKYKLLSLALASVVVSNVSAGTFTIGGFKFDEKNTVQIATLAEGETLSVHSSSRFGKYSENYVTNTVTRENEFAKFDRSKSVGRLMGLKNSSRHDLAQYVSMPDLKNTPPAPNKGRCVVELSWKAGLGLKNGLGADFVVFEAGNWEGFAVAVQKAGAKEFTPYRYQFAVSKDPIHDVNAVSFDLSDFGLAEGDMIGAIRIRNLFNSTASVGADKVDNATGQGNVVTPGESGYETASTLLQKPGGQEFPTSRLSADIVYVAVLHDVEALQIVEPATPAAPAAPTNAPAKPAAVQTTEKKPSAAK